MNEQITVGSLIISQNICPNKRGVVIGQLSMYDYFKSIGPGYSSLTIRTWTQRTNKPLDDLGPTLALVVWEGETIVRTIPVQDIEKLPGKPPIINEA